MTRKFRNILKFVLLLFPFVCYLVYMRSGAESVSFLSYFSDSFGAFGAFFEPMINKFIGPEGLLALVDSVAVTYISNLLGYFIVWLVVVCIYDLFAFIPSVMSHWLDKMKKGD